MKEKILAVMGADAVVPQQYFDTLRQNRHLEPERALLLALLEDAIHCFQKYGSAEDPIGKERFQEAEQWIMQTGNDWIFSFDNVCDLMDLDPQYLRRGLVEWRQQTLKARKREKGGGPRGQAA